MAVLPSIHGNIPGSQRLLPLARAAVSLLLLAVAADALFGLVRPWLAPGPELTEAPFQETGTINPESTAGPGGGVGSTLASARDLFGVPPNEPVPEPVQAPETRLALELRGVWVAERPEASLAIIEADREARYFRIGETVAEGATLHRVEAARVLLRRGGRFEALSLPRESLIPATEAPGPAGDSDGGVDLVGYRERFKADPRQFARLIRLIPVQRQGRLEGYRLLPGLDRALFTGLGLETGDLVTAVNGIRVGEAGAAERIIAELAGAPRVRVDLVRDGRAMALDYGLEG